VYLLLAVPVLAALLAVLPWPVSFRRTASLAGISILSVFVLLSLPSIGMFYVPALVGLTINFQNAPHRILPPRGD
jgi:hypothetical protein